MNKLNEEWKTHIKKERLRKLLTFSKAAIFFVEKMEIKKVWKWKDERNANLGSSTYPYKVEISEVIFQFENREYLFYKMKRVEGWSITKTWVYKKGNVKEDDFLSLSTEEQKIFVELMEKFSFENWLK